MKRSRIFLFAALSLVGLLAVGLILVFTPAVQTWAARKALAGQPGLTASLERVSVSLGGVSVKGLVLEQPGLRVSVPSLEANLPIIAAARGRIDLESCVAKGWVVEIDPAAMAGSSQASSAPAKDSAGFGGVFDLLQLPVDLSAGTLDVEGRVIVRGAEAVDATVALTGGGLGAGKTGKLRIVSSATLPAGAVDSLRTDLTLSVGMDGPRSISSLAALLQAEARGTQFPAGARLELALDAAREPGRERYGLEVRREARSLVKLAASLAKPGEPVAGTWQVAARDTDLTPFLLGRALPQFLIDGGGSFSAATGKAADLSLSGELKGEVSRLAVLDPRLSVLEALRLSSGFDVHVGAKTADVRTLRVAVARADGRALFEASTLQPFGLALETLTVKAGDAAKPLARLSLESLPLAWAKPWLEGMDSSGELSGAWVLTALPTGVSVGTETPTQLQAFTLTKQGETLAKGLDLRATYRADYSAEGWQLDLAGLSLSQTGKSIAEAKVKVGQRSGQAQPLIFQGDAAVDLSGLRTQPLAATLLAAEAGQVKFEYQGRVDGQVDAHAKVEVSGLRVGKDQALPNAILEARVTQKSDGSWQFTVPVTVENKAAGRSSDLSLDGSVAAGSSPLQLDARLAGRILYVEDLKAFTALMPVEAPDASPSKPVGPGQDKPATTTVPKADTQAFWSAVTGRIQLTVAKLVVNPRSELVDVTAALLLTPGELKVDQLRARGENDASLALDASVRFEAGETPYTLEAALKTTAFDVSGYTAPADGKGEPTVAAKFDITSKLEGRGINLEDLAENTTGTFNLLSKGGKLRLLRSDISEFIKGKTPVGSLVMGGLGALLSSRADKQGEGKGAAKLDEYARMAVELSDYLAEINFDQMSIALVRDKNLDLKVQDITLMAPQLRFAGTGLMRHQAGKSFAQQTLELDLQLGARERVAELLGKAGLLKETKDHLGYLPLNKPIQVKGSLGTPDNSDLKEALRGLALQKADDLLQRMIGGGK